MSTITQQQTAVPTGTFTADVVHSSLTFEVQYMGVATYGATVKDFTATLEDGVLTGSAPMRSLDIKEEAFYNHLLSPEFFDVDNHPEVSFSGAVAASGDGVEVDGEITIKGITRPATLRGTLVGPIADPHGNTRYGLKLETTIDRTAFGIEWNADMPDGTKALANDVTLQADLSLVEAA
jgi:polyisoprenoid-binding protein YceI